MQAVPLRLRPGADLRRELEARGQALGGAAFVLCGIGSLQGLRIRLAADAHETGLEGCFEILSLSGSLSRGGAHLHIAAADEAGRVLGGHLCYGNRVRTTAEVLVARLDGWALDREPDRDTGFEELVVRRRGDDGDGGNAIG